MNRTPDERNASAFDDNERRTLHGLMGERSLVEWVRQVRAGLRLPRESGEHRYAAQQLRRLWSPVSGIALPLLFLLVLALVPSRPPPPPPEPPSYIIRPSPPAPEPLDNNPTTPETPVLTPALPPEQRPQLGGPYDGHDVIERGDGTAPAPVIPLENVRAPQNGVIQVRSPVKVPWIIGGRHGGPAGHLKKYRSVGLSEAEALRADNAVLSALRWLKLNQAADGSWPANKVAMTSLAVLTFLAYGESPGDSAEFGATIQRGLAYLLAAQDDSGRFSGNYEHPIATYALCEAYAMSRNPNVRAAAEKAIDLLVKGQHPSGGFDYGLKSGDRDDTSVMGWCAQALKAARTVKIYGDPAALDKAAKLAVRGFQKNAAPDGGFGYTGPGRMGLSAVGTFCMQTLGAPRAAEVQRALAFMEGWVFDWENPTVPGANPQYYFYYLTQARHMAGGQNWKSWHATMCRTYFQSQKIRQQAIADDKGTLRDVGWWENKDQAKDVGPTFVMDTCLAALQLTVCYRYLTTSDPSPETPSAAARPADPGDVPVGTGNL